MLDAQPHKGKGLDKTVWTRVEQCFIMAAAIEIKLMGRGWSVSFVQQVLEMTLLKTTVPVSWISSNGKTSENGKPSG